MDICLVAIVKKLLEIVQSKHVPIRKGDCLLKEELLAEKLYKSLNEVVSDAEFEEDELLEDCTEGSNESSFSQEIVDEDGNPVPFEVNQCSIKRKTEILKLVNAHPKWSINTLQKKGGAVEYKNHTYKKIWMNQIKRGGTRFEQWRIIDNSTYKSFQEARSELKHVHGSDLKIWALQAAQSFRDPTFKFRACHSWIHKFKQKHRISSRKVTKLVSKKGLADSDAIQLAAISFQNEIKNISGNYHPDQVINTDQCGFQYEMTSNRTLSFKGEKLTVACIKSPTNLATHSYTCQYVISLSGRIRGNVFLCLQEPNGKLGERVKKHLFSPDNVTLTTSHSGKLTTSHHEYFLDNVILKNMTEDFLYVLDSWGGQTNSQSYTSRFGIENRPSCNLRVIPKNCTPLCQPLDTTFHRQLKYFVRAVYSEYRMNYSSEASPTEEITTRNNIIKTHSLIHNQLISPLFTPMIRYCWFSAGLTDEKPLFKSVKEACFSFDGSDPVYCTQDSCGKVRFLKCSHCRQTLCFNCFYYKYHFHSV